MYTFAHEKITLSSNNYMYSNSLWKSNNDINPLKSGRLSYYFYNVFCYFFLLNLPIIMLAKLLQSLFLRSSPGCRSRTSWRTRTWHCLWRTVACSACWRVSTTGCGWWGCRSPPTSSPTWGAPRWRIKRIGSAFKKVFLFFSNVSL